MDDEGLFRLKDVPLADALAVALARERAEETLGRVTTAVSESEPKGSAEAYLPDRGWVNQYDEAVGILDDTRRDAPRRSDLVETLIQTVRSVKPEEEM